MRLSYYFHHRKEMKQLCLCRHLAFACLAFILVACQAAPTTPVAVPTMPLPPQAQMFMPPEPATLVPPPAPSPLPTLAVTPTAIPVALDKWPVFESPAKTFSFRYPPDWAGREYTQAITRTVYPLTVDFIWLRGPDKATAPEFVVMYNWPSLDPVQSPGNADAWSSVAGLAKIFLYPSCATTFDSPAPLTLSGQQTMGAKFVVQCDRLYAGYLVGTVRKGVNYGLLVDVPVEDWDAWRPTFETMLASFALNP
jgi:hypothetical protein